MRIFFCFLVFFLVSVTSALAQVDTDNFYIRAFGGADLIPPTTPVLTSVTPVAPTQIDITWNASTDNFAIGGYVVTRNGTDVATTSLLTYSDTSLSASTTYTYSVRSFDFSYNYSTTSNSISTTTPDTPPPEEPEETEENESVVGSTASKVVLDSFNIEADISSVNLQIETAKPSRLELRWGRSDDFEIGYIVSSVYRTKHSFIINDLEPGTSYRYELIGYSQYGKVTVIRDGSFVTKANAIDYYVPNLDKFFAVENGNDINLSWSIPAGDVDKIRILRSYFGFPKHPTDGAVVYQGLGSEVVDPDILSQYSPVYYTAFVYDSLGNISSGAVTIVYGQQEVTDNFSKDDEVDYVPSDKATSTIEKDKIAPGTLMPELTDINIIQGEDTFVFSDEEIYLKSQDYFLVSIPVNLIANNLKSIIVSIIDPTNNKKHYSFLLRLNKDRSAYEAVISPIIVVGSSQIILEVYDYEAYVIGTYQTPIYYYEAVESDTEKVFFPDVFFYNKQIIVAGITMSAFALFIILFLWKKQYEDNL